MTSVTFKNKNSTSTIYTNYRNGEDWRTAIDSSYLYQLAGLDKKFKGELFAIFKENAKKNLKKMEEATEVNNKVEWYMAVHAFKGASSSIGAFFLAKLLENAQRKPDAPKEDKRNLLIKTKIELDLVFRYIENDQRDLRKEEESK